MHSLLQKFKFHVGSAAIAAAGLRASLASAQEDVFGDVPNIGTGVNSDDIRVVVLNVLRTVLNFMALAAVVFVVIAGIRLIFSQGEDEQRQKAIKTIIYVIAGLIVILLASTIVGFITDTITQAAGN